MRLPCLPGLLIAAACGTAPPPPPADAAMGGGLRSDVFPAAERVLHGFAAPSGNANWATGDSVLFGLRLQNGDTEHRWLLRLRLSLGHTIRARATSEDGRGDDAMREIGVTYRRQGYFYRTTIAGEVRTVGVDSALLPVDVTVFAADDGRELGASGIEVPADFLASGLHAATIAAQQLDGMRQTTTAEEAEILKLTSAYGSGLMATVALLQVVQQDHVLADYFWQVVEKPSVWSLLTHLGASATISIPFEEAVAATSTPVGLPDTADLRVLPVTVEVNDAPALYVDLLVGPSARPFALCGGVRGGSARSPSRPELRFDLLLLAATLGDGTDLRLGK